MAGWIPTDAAAWLRDRCRIPTPWPEVLVITDLRFWANPKACDYRERPSVRDLAATWGWGKNRVCRWVGRPELWVDSSSSGDRAGTERGQRRDSP